MRLQRLRLRRFRCFYEADIEFADGTVLVGPNNAGKSTIVDGIRSLYLDRDPAGREYTRRSTASWAGPGSSGRLPGEPLDLVDDPPLVIGEYGDLSERERATWGPVLDGGLLRFGARWAKSGDSMARCLVVGSGSPVAREWLGAIESAERPEDEGERWFRGFLTTGIVARDKYGVWVTWHALTVLLELHEHATWPDPPSPVQDFPGPSFIVHVPGPEAPQPAVADLLRPLIRERALGLLEDDPGSLEPEDDAWLTPGDLSRYLDLLPKATADAQEEVDSLFSASLARYLGFRARLGIGSLLLRLGLRSGWTVAQRAIDALLEDLTIEVTEDADAPEQPTARGVSSWQPLETLGGGARRAAAVAALELYRDPDLVDPGRSLLLVVEEPEVGMHPGLQRRIATALRELPTFGVQTIVVSHSSIFVNEVDPAAIRLVRPAFQALTQGPADSVLVRNHEAVPPANLQEIAKDLGCTPADVLLASRFVIVEGESDGAILTTWAHIMGFDPDRAGVRFVPAHGSSKAEQVARLLGLIYPGASILVLLDNGADTRDQQIELEARFGDRVTVRLMDRTEIEAYFTHDAVVRWLQRQDAAAFDPARIADQLGSGTKRKRALKDITSKVLGRDYRVVEDGVAIAGLMAERDLAPELVSLLTALSNPDVGGNAPVGG